MGINLLPQMSIMLTTCGVVIVSRLFVSLNPYIVSGYVRYDFVIYISE